MKLRGDQDVKLMAIIFTMSSVLLLLFFFFFFFFLTHNEHGTNKRLDLFLILNSLILLLFASSHFHKQEKTHHDHTTKETSGGLDRTILMTNSIDHRNPLILHDFLHNDELPSEDSLYTTIDGPQRAHPDNDADELWSHDYHDAINIVLPSVVDSLALAPILAFTGNDHVNCAPLVAIPSLASSDHANHADIGSISALVGNDHVNHLPSQGSIDSFSLLTANDDVNHSPNSNNINTILPSVANQVGNPNNLGSMVLENEGVVKFEEMPQEQMPSLCFKKDRTKKVKKKKASNKVHDHDHMKLMSSSTPLAISRLSNEQSRLSSPLEVLRQDNEYQSRFITPSGIVSKACAKKGDTLDAIWKEICEKKSTQSNSPFHQQLQAYNMEVMNDNWPSSHDHDNNTSCDDYTHKDAKISVANSDDVIPLDELQCRADSFIFRFREHMQREQSLLNYMQMVDRGAS